MLPERELPTIASARIKPYSLAQFLSDQEPGLKVRYRSGDYSRIFEQIRSLPFNRQKELFVSFFDKHVKKFPHGKDFGELLARINNITPPQEAPDPSKLQELSNQHLERLNLKPLPIKIIENDWWIAKMAARKVEAAYVKGRETAWQATQTAVYATMDPDRVVARHAARDLAQDMAGTATRRTPWVNPKDVMMAIMWVIVKDFMPKIGYEKGNPSEPLIEMSELGCYPIGVIEEEGEEEFVIFVPPIQKAA